MVLYLGTKIGISSTMLATRFTPQTTNIWLSSLIAGLLIWWAAPHSTAQTRTKPDRAQGNDTTLAKEAAVDTTSADEDEGDEEEGVSDTTLTKSAAADTTVSDEEEAGDETEADSTGAAQDHDKKPVKAGKRSGIYRQEEEEVETAWSLDARLDYDSWRLRRGLEFTRALPSLTPSLLLTHESGLSVELDALSSYGKIWQFTLWNVILGYEYDFTDWFTSSLQFTRYRYKDKEENAEASKFNAWTLIGNFDAQLCAVDLTFDLYPGDDPSLYVTLDVSKAFELGDWTITPMFETCYLTSRIHFDLPPPIGPKDLSFHGFSTLSLQCEVAWQPTDALAFSLNTAFIRLPFVELASKPQGFSTTLSAVYTFDF